LNLPIDLDASRAMDDSHADCGLRMDECTFRAFYEQTSQPLLRYLVAVTRRADLGEDILQETYCRFLTTRLPDMDRVQAQRYLFRIATNLIRDRWRRPNHEIGEEALDEVASNTPHFDRRLGVRQAFDRMKPRERQLLWLAYIEGSNHQEIAECTGLQAGSIRQLLFRARRKFAELMGELSEGTFGVTK
jgi:RNA polymerase sigma-70 factor, ECF subfamily